MCKSGQSKSLTPRAFDVLLYLIEHRGRVVEKQEIFEQIWKETFVTDNALMRAVKEIRRELADDATAPHYIETVHKRGYRFIAEVFEREEMSEPPAIADGFLAAESESVNQEKDEKPISQTNKRKWFFVALPIALLAIGAFAFWFFSNRPTKQIESIAVMPFVNESGNADVEYLSDGMTETIIGSLSQLPNLNVKSRSSVFRYKGKDANAQTVGRELNVQAILTGRVVERGEDLTLYLSLVDAATENNLWSKQYSRKLPNLVAVQTEIVRDVAAHLKTKLSGADEQKLARNYTENVEAYQFYLKGRYHVLKITLPETQIGISYFEQAIDLDPNYALAYVGLADAYLSLALGGEIAPTELFPKAKAAANRAIEIDDRLAEAYAILGNILFFYDWDFKEAENQTRRALELNPNSTDIRLSYAAILSNTGRHAEGLAEARRARELEPLNLRTGALEALFLIHAGQTDEGLAGLQKVLELEPNFYIAHLFAASAYIEKGMFREAANEAHRASEISGGIKHPLGILGYVLGKSDKQREARAVLEDLLKLSKERYISLYDIAMIYNGLGERDETLAWLERGLEKRDVRMALLKVELTWNNLRDDPRFQDIMRRTGL
ncbi:MAG TPA: winged helix-turn-helix domain-containing protein [Pyrinomonadaceae bacterium]|nr:winged helix-turn-helix domain-containing protein [Pyrinomonadaceae bacterium]